ncbi:Uncharacterised protein [BD1-7 clade bacterium]|uniref:Methyltransferase type 11 domain-containing protein n=1 Tax=BD1-7 clade bacterium TaxID=2029982 RepID=A0A5S9QUF8_9GAMM|nr:Uncharacterised protein [BD1-7 clade bacterium]CAA0122467.1 Uncharacterised protein [BD1-7 clade bacterium]
MKKNPLAEKLLGRQAKYPLAESIPVMERWFKEPTGRSMLCNQQAVVDDFLQTLFGYHLLQLSVSRDVNLVDASRIRHKFRLSPLSGASVGAVCEEEQLPLEQDCIDLAVVHHLLDYSQNPHQTLRELSRVVIPSGHVLIIGFNPVSLLGVYAASKRLSKSRVWQNHPVTVRRLVDWLTLMDFSVQKVHYGFYMPPVKWMNKSRLCRGLNRRLTQSQWPTGGFYAVLAKKEVAPLTPRRMKWQKVSSIIPQLEPSLYQHPQNGVKTKSGRASVNSKSGS